MGYKYMDFRWSAAVALGKIGTPQAVEALITALWDVDDGVKKSAAEALVKMYREGALNE